jgi:hypothetical protein
MTEPKRKNGTFIHGIASSEHLDSSGERIKIEGVDISSLTKDGVLNVEHQSKEASSIVGKIWEAKKILKRSDCENDHHKYFWDKVKMPYIYIAGELFDAVGHKEASEIAAMVRFDSQESLNKDSKRLINFSIEGSRVEKTGQVITKCIARKVSITLTPCNKICEAEELKIDDKAKKEADSGKFSFIQDIMSKSDEPSCQMMKGENPFLYKNEDVVIPAKDAVEEHKQLVAVLESPSHKDDKKEAKKQRAELKEYKEKLDSGVEKAAKKVNPKDQVLNYSKFPPKAPSPSKKKMFETSVAAIHEKKKLGKYESNTRKALTASCGLGSSPSTKVQGAAIAKAEEMPKAQVPAKPSIGSKIGTTESGKDIFSHAKVGEYKGFTPQDHGEAADFHRKMILASPSIKAKEHHLNKMRLHQSAFSTNKEREIKGGVPRQLPQQALPAPIVPPMQAKTPVMNPKPTSPGGKLGYSEMASNYGGLNTPAPAMPAMPKTPALKMVKNECLLVRVLSESDVNKASKNVREQRKKVFGTKSQPGANTAMREKHINHIKQFVSKFLNLGLKPSGGKIDAKTGERRDAEALVGEDKPDWRSGSFEAQWNPEAIVHEIAHLMLLPEGVGLEEGQSLMDRQYAEVQKQHGYMKQKRSEGEIQPMAAEQLIRRFIGLPPSQVSVPVKSKDDPPRTAVENPDQVIGTRVKQGKDKEGQDKYVDLIRQARNLHPEHKERLEKVFSGYLRFDPDKGWSKQQRSLDAAITNRQPGAVVARQDKSAPQQSPQQSPQPAPSNVIQMKKPAAPPAPAAPEAYDPEVNQSGTPPMKIAKSDQREIMKMLGDRAFEQFEKKEELVAFLTEKLPNLSQKEIKAIAKAVAYTSEKKKEAALASLVEVK